MALKLEKEYTKEEILELYVNTIYFGDGYYGIKAASEGYFGKDPSCLSDYECTMLAGLPNAPSAYALTEHAELAEQRQGAVLRQMVNTVICHSGRQRRYRRKRIKEKGFCSQKREIVLQTQRSEDWLKENNRIFRSGSLSTSFPLCDMIKTDVS